MTDSSKLDRFRWPLIVAGLVVAFFAGMWLNGPEEPPATAPAPEAEETEIWTCSMHPQIRLPKPGPCPICGMNLVPATSLGEAGEGERELVLSEAARRLAEVRTVPVERRPTVVEVRLVGKVDYDESRIGDITSYVPGRLERLFVDYTGVPVKRGEHMVDIYSPELIAAQEELLQAIDAAQTLQRSRLEVMRRTAGQTVAAAREKLRLWGLLPEQIAAIEAEGKVQELITLYSPMSGIVIEKHANQGMYVDTGSRIYTIADMTHLWVRLEAYESDMSWVRLGQEVEFTADAFPGEVFGGRVSFVDPVLDPATRTVKLRVNVENDQLLLKPEMLVRAVVKARVGSSGVLVDRYLAGKWICPMHPEIVKDGSGSCDICGMPLATAESLGFVADTGEREAPLVIPASAPLITGRRAVVYVEKAGSEGLAYEGREVRLGPKAGDLYIVRSGLEEGERVVVEGNFKIDSALQIQARPSMMSARKTQAPVEGATGLTSYYERYLALQQALAADDPEAARSAFDRALAAARGLDLDELPTLLKALEAGRTAADLDAMRVAFHDLSRVTLSLARDVGHTLPHDLVVVFCPMAFENGAEWMQAGSAVENPYYGSMMLACGTVAERLPPRDESAP